MLVLLICDEIAASVACAPGAVAVRPCAARGACLVLLSAASVTDAASRGSAAVCSAARAIAGAGTASSDNVRAVMPLVL